MLSKNIIRKSNKSVVSGLAKTMVADHEDDDESSEEDQNTKSKYNNESNNKNITEKSNIVIMGRKCYIY